MLKRTLPAAFVILCCVLISFTQCIQPAANKDELASDESLGLTEEEEGLYQDVKIPVLVKKTEAWPGNKLITGKAEVHNMNLNLVFNISEFSQSLIPMSADKKDTFPNTIFNLAFFVNNQPLEIEMNPEKHSWFYRNGFKGTDKRSLDQSSSVKNLSYGNYVDVTVPMFAFSKFPANKPIVVEVRLWQDYFITNGKLKKEATGTFDMYESDTLKQKLIDNHYSFVLTVPEIYKSEIVCDSIVLQNDESWSPVGSDNTIWKSSMPDIYFALHDMYGSIQGSSKVEKSTSVFSVCDTVPYYHYRPKERFTLWVYDWDMFSKNDVLGWWKGSIDRFAVNRNYTLKFGHIRKFCFRRKYYGKIN